MVSHKNSKKARKPIETSLGKAPVKSKEKETDVSHLQQPIETSVSGLKQIFSIYETATNEVKNFLMYECDVMYECRICRTIFRSLANFILHKRNFCKDKFSPLGFLNNNSDSFKINIDPPKEVKKECSKLGKVIQKLHEIERVHESAKNCLTMNLSESGNEHVGNMDDCERKTSSFNNIVLEKIDSNNSGIFQTLVDNSSISPTRNSTERGEFMKSEVMEIHKKMENDVPILDPQGKICGFTSSKLHQTSLFPKSEFKCSECNHKFATQKSLTNHIKCIHNPTRIVYICPTCKDSFANPWCVYRHLLRVHRMSNKQVRRMREQVHNSWIRRGEESSIQKKKSSGNNQSVGDSEKQWINDIEGDKDFQMCAGCGKHFERKAALHSHSQMCAKRLEVCHNIKENAKKKGEEDAVEKAKLNKVASGKATLKGASKRKGKSICSYRKKQNDLSEVIEPISNCRSQRVNMVNSTDGKNNNEHGTLKTLDDNLSETLLSKGSKLAIMYKENDDDSSHPTSTTECCKHKTLFSARKREKNTNMEDRCLEINNGNINVRNPSPSSTSENVSLKKGNRTDANTLLKCGKTDIREFVPRVGTSNMARKVKKKSQIEDNTANSLQLRKQVTSHISTAESNVSSTSFRNSSINFHEDGEIMNKDYIQELSDPHISRSDLFEDETETLLGSPSSSCQVISRSNSFEEAIYLSTSDESLQDKLEIPSSSNNSGILIKSEKRDVEEVDPLSLDSINSSGSVCVISDSNEDQDDITLTNKHNSDLFSNKVTFEMFVKQVATDKKSNANNKYLDENDASIPLKRKRKRDTNEKCTNCSENGEAPYEYSDNEDDVIFVEESVDTSGAILGPENGFPGFPSEETSRTSYSIDFSNLSYNNPLVSKTKDSSIISHKRSPQNFCYEKKSKTEEVCVKTKVTQKDMKSDCSFIPRAAPYMDRNKMMCIPCGVSFRAFGLLLWHMSAHFSWFRFQCSKCSFISFNKYDCMSHAQKDHDLSESVVSRYILPLPNWKTVLMSHEFRLLKDRHDLKGKHTDEKIGFEESHDYRYESSNIILESDSKLFGELCSEKLSDVELEKDNVKKCNKAGKGVIDIQESIRDCQKLPEPVQLAMPADISDIFKTFTFDEDVFSPDETVETLDHYADESNDDWGLSKVYEEPTKAMTMQDSDEETRKDEIISPNIRPSRTRTKVKQDDFVYYDTDINSALKVTDIFKSGSQKNRSDGVTAKPKISNKSVPTTQKKKS